MSRYKYVFGPVPSRRLGASLGVDVLPLKTCTQNCIYCQLCVTQEPEVEVKTYAPQEEVLAEIYARLNEGVHMDYITFSGSGEPTLHKALGEMICQLKRNTDKRVAVITNGTMLWNARVREALALADVVMPSLDAFDEDSFEVINRPHHKITFDMLMAGLKEFRASYKGQMWLEIFLLKGLNDSPEQLAKIKQLVSDISPDRIQLNTAVRPGCDKTLEPLSDAELAAAAAVIGYDAEGIKLSRKANQSVEQSALAESILAMVERRPCSASDISEGLQANMLEVNHAIDELLKKQLIQTESVAGEFFYRTSDAESSI
ncbi:MAG: radical SAM protein [Phycisphaerae bacterium]|jgi:wyosine [tRNA(Phe)-imidazoG37] synthetase (radical SAM superfamily)